MVKVKLPVFFQNIKEIAEIEIENSQAVILNQLLPFQEWKHQVL